MHVTVAQLVLGGFLQLVFIAAHVSLWRALRAAKKALLVACPPYVDNVVAGIVLPVTDDPRWQICPSMGGPTLRLGAVSVRKRTSASPGMVMVDCAVITYGIEDIPYIRAVWRAYQQRRALESIEDETTPLKLGSTET